MAGGATPRGRAATAMGATAAMTEWLQHPAVVLGLGAVLVALLPARLRALPVLLAPLAALWAMWSLAPGVLLSVPFLGTTIELLEVDPVRRLFATVFALMAFGGGLYALGGGARRTELAAAFAYAAAALGVCFAGDLVTLFLCWEAMALASLLVVWCGDGEGAHRAGLRYALMHLGGGVVLMAGIAWLALETGDIDVRALTLASPATWLVLVGVLVNAAAPPFSAWLPDAYPEASPSGTVFLSAYTTKAAVLALILLFPGTQLLVWVGLWMVFYGIVYALLENDMRRILAYSIVNQVGFMVVGVGIGTGLAINGAAAHAFAHILYKALLMMSAGAVLYRTGERRCSHLGGLVQTMPWTTLFGVVGALAISAFPLTSGFVSKSMVNQAAADGGMAWTWALLLAATAGVFLHAGIKFPWFVFFQKDSGLRPAEAPWPMRLAMGLFAALCILLGVFPEWLYALLPYPVDFEPHTAAHVVSQLQLLLFAGLAFFLLLPLMRRTLTISLDTDWFWRRAFPALWQVLESAWHGVLALAKRARHGPLQSLLNLVFRPHGPDGVLARTWPTGSMLLWVVVMLGVLLVLGALTD